WTAFGPTNANGVATTNVAVDALHWVREQLKPDYFSFTGAGGSDVSDEFYCSNDVLNYDNYDFISPVAAGSTYYCVGFNVHAQTPPPACTADDAEINLLQNPSFETPVVSGAWDI